MAVVVGLRVKVAHSVPAMKRDVLASPGRQQLQECQLVLVRFVIDLEGDNFLLIFYRLGW